MRHISAADQKIIVAIIRQGGRLTWDAIKAAAATKCPPREKPWSRQSLSANGAIKAAYDASRNPPVRPMPQRELNDQQAELQELRNRYEQLVRRHRQLLFNASLLPGGVQLLADPLPDNTSVQGMGQAAERAANRKSAPKPRNPRAGKSQPSSA